MNRCSVHSFRAFTTTLLLPQTQNRKKASKGRALTEGSIPLTNRHPTPLLCCCSPIHSNQPTHMKVLKQRAPRSAGAKKPRKQANPKKRKTAEGAANKETEAASNTNTNNNATTTPVSTATPTRVRKPHRWRPGTGLFNFYGSE